MNLLKLDDQYVRITTKQGEIFDGVCDWSGAEYCMHEIGREEEALAIDHWMFFKSEIETVEAIPETTAFLWYGRPAHRMHLAAEPFDQIDRGEKTVEMRLYDEKRRKINVGDAIRFESTADETDVLFAEVKALRVFPSFEALYRSLPPAALGYEDASSADPADMRRYYSAEEEKKYGVVGIEIELM